MVHIVPKGHINHLAHHQKEEECALVSLSPEHLIQAVGELYSSSCKQDTIN